MREHDDVDLIFTFAWFPLDHGPNRDRSVGEDARDIGERTGTIEYAHAKVVGRDHLLHRQDRDTR
jgi:hypothetical protein